jgi:glycosyltransferase involved in cell wall biosynthesis
MNSLPRLGYLSGAPRVTTRPDAEAGGARAHILGVLDAFQRLGWETERFIAGDQLPAFVSGKGSEGQVTSARYRAFIADISRIILGYLNAYRVGRQIREIHWVYERYAAFQALGRDFRRKGIPWILETSSVGYRSAFELRRSTALKSVLRRSEMKIYRDCDAVICPTPAVKEDIIRFAGVQPGKILALPNGVDTDYYDPRRFTPRRIFDGFTVGFVGRLYPWQGIDLLLEAIASITSRTPGGVHAVIIGDGMDRQRLAAECDRLGLARRVKFLGHLPMDEIPGCLMGCDVSYIGHRRTEFGHLPFSPIKLFESLSLSVPVVCTAEPEFIRFIRGGEDSFIFRPENVSSLGQALVTAKEMRGSLLAMGECGREAMIKGHTWKHRVEELIDWARNDRGFYTPPTADPKRGAAVG